MTRWTPAVVAAVLLGSCAGGAPAPVEIDQRNDACSWCRMAISDRRFAAQIGAPAEEPELFDDIGCLRDRLRGGGSLRPGAVAWVADHRTQAWVAALQAVYAEVPGLATPMASGLAAWSDEASRRADPDAAGSSPISVSEIFGAFPPPGARP
jgi:copper chaperone NosL